MQVWIKAKKTRMICWDKEIMKVTTLNKWTTNMYLNFIKVRIVITLPYFHQKFHIKGSPHMVLAVQMHQINLVYWQSMHSNRNLSIKQKIIIPVKTQLKISLISSLGLLERVRNQYNHIQRSQHQNSPKLKLLWLQEHTNNSSSSPDKKPPNSSCLVLHRAYLRRWILSISHWKWEAVSLRKFNRQWTNHWQPKLWV